MANHMAEVAKLLGVEIGEIFEINKCNGTYMLCYEGLVHTESGHMVNATFNDLLFGKLNIKRKPWKPEKEYFYWNVQPDGEFALIRWLDNAADYNNYKLGNCYRTKEDANKDYGKWKLFYASDEVLEV